MTRKWKPFVVAALWVTQQCGLAQAPATTILQIDAVNKTSYVFDPCLDAVACPGVSDHTKWGTDPKSAGVRHHVFGQYVDLADIVAVNGQQAKGIWIAYGSPVLKLDVNPPVGNGAIADTVRFAMVEQYLEILSPEGIPIGTIMGHGSNSGDPPPGAPEGITRDNVTITGGTGAFLGARGQGGNSNSVIRTTSVTEDPWYRRINGDGSPSRFIVHLIPMSRPEIVAGPDGVSVFHSDLSLVTAAKPAKAGETVILRMTGLGPTRPGVVPGQAFPADALQEVNSPVAATVNGKPAEVLNKIGWPGTVGHYRVDLRIPDGTLGGTANIQVAAAWITGLEVKIPLQ
jgi:hypothetical protein